MDARSNPTASVLLRQPGLAPSLGIAGIGAAALGGAWFFQLVIGLAPCPLCLEQRTPYYIAVPLALAVAALASRNAPRPVIAAGLVALAGLMAWGAGLAIYHVGVEQKIFTLPATCATGGRPPGSVGDLLSTLAEVRVPSCDEIPWSLMGISLAGWNALIATGLTVVALAGLAGLRRSGQGSSSVSQ